MVEKAWPRDAPRRPVNIFRGVTTALQVPRVDFVAQREALGSELDAAIERVLRSGRFILGAEVDAFESEFAEYCGVSHCVATGSGTDALRLVLSESGVGPGDEVVVPAYTFVATAAAARYCGAEPVFADIKRKQAELVASLPSTHAYLRQLHGK
jgi:dTDP-4-amino-4,6-dideoxygalactose transaminase